MSNFDTSSQYQESSFTRPVIGLCLVAAGLAGAAIYFAVRANDLDREIVALKSSVKTEVSALQNANKSAQLERERVAAELQKMVEVAEAKSQQAAVTAGLRARRYTDELAKKISSQHAEEIQSTSQQLQQSSQSAHQQLSAQIGEMKQNANQTSTQVTGIAAEVNTVKTAVASTKSEVDRIISDMRSVRGDLGMQSGLIATNARELSALRMLGERDYFEFQLSKTKAPQRVGDIAVQLKRLDSKKNRYTVDLIANDKKMEKKDRTVNEPVQFLMAKKSLPYELVVNEVRRDMIVGYLSAPKIREPRN